MIGILSTFVFTALISLDVGVTITPPQPTQGEDLTISYNSKAEGAALTEPRELAIIYIIQSKDTTVTDAQSMNPEDHIWTYSVRIPENAYFIQFKLEDSLGRTIDNEKRWYNLPVYTREGAAPPNAHLSVGRALLLAENPDYERARSEFEKELDLYPWNWEAQRGMWELQIQSAESKEAVKDAITEEIEELLKSTLDSLSLLYEVAITTYSELEEPSKAQGLLVRFLNDYNEPERLSRILNAYFLAMTSKSDNLRESAEDLPSIASPEQKEIIMYDYYFALSLSFRQNEAQEVLKKFMKDYPDSKKMPFVAYRYIISTTKPNTMDNTKALQDYLKKYPESPLATMAYIQLARYYAPTDWKLSKSYYEKAIEKDSSQPYPYNYFAYDCSLREMDLLEGEEAILKAIDLASLNYYRRRYPDRSFEERKETMTRDLAAFYDTYGWIKFKQGEYKNALQLIGKAVGFVDKESASPEILEHLAQTYEKVDSLDKAINVYMEILKRDPQAEKVRKEALETFLKRGSTEEEFDSILSTFSSTSSGEGSPAPDFTVNDMEDKEVKLSDFRGKVVVINFWATWCPPCRQEIPLLNQLVDSFKKNSKVVFLAISGEKKDRIERFLKSNEFKYNVCYGGMKASRDYKVMYIPTHIIITPDGQIYSKHVGFVEGIDKTLEKEIKEALGESN